MNSKEEFTVQMKRKVAEIEEILKEYLPKPEGYQKVIMEAMEYSLMAGGKRLRPMLMRETRDYLAMKQKRFVHLWRRLK